MKNMTTTRRRRSAGFTLVEVMISMTIVTGVMAMAMSTYLFGLRTMYKDTQRLVTNASLRYFVAQVSKETIDASEFYIFPYYTSLNGAVNLNTSVTGIITDSFGIDIYHGDCLVLVTRVSLDSTANVRQFRIYYRVVTNSNQEGVIRYWESQDYGVNGTATTLTALLNAVNLNANPAFVGGGSNRILAQRARGRPRASDPTQNYPVFSSEFPTITKTNENVSINVEIINGSTINNLLSSSSFNYTISPRR
jgi:prepilin-type N-terminal cleavage/methylation domain-containing protein